jgi:hypothetical protein
MSRAAFSAACETLDIVCQGYKRMLITLLDQNWVVMKTVFLFSSLHPIVFLQTVVIIDFGVGNISLIRVPFFMVLNLVFLRSLSAIWSSI